MEIKILFIDIMYQRTQISSRSFLKLFIKHSKRLKHDKHIKGFKHFKHSDFDNAFNVSR